MTDFDLGALKEWLKDKVDTETARNPDVDESGVNLDPKTVPLEERKWVLLTDAIAVVADLRNSTSLPQGRKWGSVGAIYEAAVAGLVEIYERFDADFIQIQGDGAYAIFWGNNRYARAVCAGITVVTFTKDIFEVGINAKFDQLPKTGYKVGVAAGDLLVKRVGSAETHEPVWAGNAVNYAAKAAQQCEPGQMLVTAGVWAWVETNDYLAVTCSCGTGPSSSIWNTRHIQNLREGDDESQGRLLDSRWCPNCGHDFCAAVMAGKTTREDVGVRAAMAEMTQAIFANPLEQAVRKQKRSREAWKRGLRSLK